MPQHVANHEMECESHAVGLNGGMGGNACEKGAGKVHSAQMRGCKATMCVLCVCVVMQSHWLHAMSHNTQHTTWRVFCLFVSLGVQFFAHWL